MKFLSEKLFFQIWSENMIFLLVFSYLQNRHVARKGALGAQAPYEIFQIRCRMNDFLANICYIYAFELHKHPMKKKSGYVPENNIVFQFFTK